MNWRNNVDYCYNDRLFGVLKPQRSWHFFILLTIIFLLSCTNDHSTEIQEVEPIPIENKYLIDADKLKTLINQSNIKILDFRKKKFYDKGHIPNALNIWRTDIEDASYPYKGMMASQAQIETLFGKLGIKTDDALIIYDDNGLCDSARLWWILQSYGFTNAKFLHGGMKGWKAINAEVSTQQPFITETVFKFPEQEKQYHASKEEVQEAIKNKTLIIDTRTTDEFSGKTQKKGAAKGGRISGSIHIDWMDAVDYYEDRCIRPLEDLKNIYSQINTSKDDPIIVYCHSGVRSAHTYFVLTELLGYQNVKNYDGSWTEWSHFDELDFERDEEEINN